MNAKKTAAAKTKKTQSKNVKGPTKKPATKGPQNDQPAAEAGMPTMPGAPPIESMQAPTPTPSESGTTKSPRKVRAAKEAKPKRLTAIDAAAQVLAETKVPMTSKELIAAMAERKLWNSPAGQTPHATLYSAILREISAKGAESRFVKCAERGKFTAKA